ncbi:hypothetical protein QNM99_16960 [Pseudomonas sp. PCH446]
MFFCYAIYTIFGFFKHPAPADKPSQAVASPALASVEKPVAVVAAPVPAVPVEPVHIDSKPEPIDYFDKFASKFDLRLAAILERKPEPGDSRPWLEFQIDVVDPSFRVKERFDRKSLAALGWAIERTDYGIKLSKQDIVYVVRPWPLDNFGKVPNKTTSDLRTGPQTSELAQPSKGLSVSSSVSTGNAGARFTVVEDTSRFHASTGSSQ